MSTTAASSDASPPAGTPEVHDDPPRAVTMARIKSFDGMRGIGVMSVVIYHANNALFTGALFNLTMFFVLSGYLITTLLLAEQHKTDTVDLGNFWARRARRLLPAAIAGVLLAQVAAWVIHDAHIMETVMGDALSSIAYSFNWWQIVTGSRYGAGFQMPSVLQHYWSLAIEEQFYLVLPLVFLGVLRIVRRLGNVRVNQVLGGLAVMTMAFAAWTTARIYNSGNEYFDTRIYFGTDTRVFELATGVLLACILNGRERRGVQIGRVGQIFGTVCAIGFLGVMIFIHITDDIVYRGGLMFAALLCAGMTAAASTPCTLSRVLAWGPFVWLGDRSYGIYIYHWPILLMAVGHFDGWALAAIVIGATIGLACLSKQYLEDPIRYQKVNVTWGQAGAVLAATVLVTVVAGSAMRREAAIPPVSPDVALPFIAPATTDSTGPPGTAVGGGPPPTQRAPASPTRVLMLGDSLLWQSETSFKKEFADHHIELRLVGGPGQSLDWHDSVWLTDLERAIAEFRPDTVVLEAAIFNELDKSYETGEYDTPADVARWTDLANRLTDIAGATGAKVYWVLTPVTGPAAAFYGPMETRVPKANEIYRQIVAERGLGVIDWGQVFSPDGKYHEDIIDAHGESIPVHAVDQFHFNPAGQALMARYTVAVLLA